MFNSFLYLLLEVSTLLRRFFNTVMLKESIFTQSGRQCDNQASSLLGHYKVYNVAMLFNPSIQCIYQDMDQGRFPRFSPKTLF